MVIGSVLKFGSKAIPWLWNTANSYTGGELGKFVKKNAGNLAGKAINYVSNKSSTIQKIAQPVADMAVNLGNNQTLKTINPNIAKQLDEGGRAARGENVAFDINNENSKTALVDPSQPNLHKFPQAGISNFTKFAKVKHNKPRVFLPSLSKSVNKKRKKHNKHFTRRI